ncbi:unnamed protein product [Chrysoparadoxa australica]
MSNDPSSPFPYGSFSRGSSSPSPRKFRSTSHPLIANMRAEEEEAAYPSRDDLHISSLFVKRTFLLELLDKLEEDVQLQYMRVADDEGWDIDEEKVEAEAYHENVIRTALLFTKSMIGGYVLYTPKMMELGGLLSSVVALVVLALLVLDNMLRLCACADITGARTFGAVARAAYGPTGAHMVETALLFSQLAFCITYFIFIEDNVPPVFPPPPTEGGIFWSLLHENQMLCLQILLYVPLVFVRRMKSLAAGMLVANFCTFAGLFMVMGLSAAQLASDGVAPGIRIKPTMGTDFFLFLGGAVMCFEGTGLVLPVRKSLHPSLHWAYPHLVSGVMALITLTFCSVGVLGYAAFGADTQSFITVNLGDTTQGKAAILFYCVAIIFTYAVMAFPAVAILERWLSYNRGAKAQYKREKNLLRVLVVLSTAAAAKVAGREFSKFAGLIGALCSAPLALIYPVLFHLKVRSTTYNRGSKIFPEKCRTMCQPCPCLSFITNLHFHSLLAGLGRKESLLAQML